MSKSRNSSRLDEAARWFAVRRRGVMTLEERAEYDSWRLDRRNAADMTEFERVWTALEAVRGQVGSEAVEPARAPRAQFRRPALFAVVCAVSLGLGVLSYSGDSGFWTTLDWVER